MIRNTMLLLMFMFVGSLFAANKHGKPLQETDVNDEAISYLLEHEIDMDSCQVDLYETVYKWIGTRYKYGGTKRSGGIDCSGFAKNIYKEVYQKELLGGSANIFPSTFALEKSQLEVGDLVFFKIKKGRISHVGIYLGNNKFVHAAVHGGVRIDSLDAPYYKKTFFKGGRI